jgi:hypothetical protein
MIDNYIQAERDEEARQELFDSALCSWELDIGCECSELIKLFIKNGRVLVDDIEEFNDLYCNLLDRSKDYKTSYGVYDFSEYFLEKFKG